MLNASVQRQIEDIKKEIAKRKAPKESSLETFRTDPAQILTKAGMSPDTWQTNLLRSQSRRMLLLCSRQSGKSTTSAALALKSALLQPDSLVLLLSPTQRQSGELFRDKVLRLYNSLGRPVPAASETALTLTLQNGSRIISLPGDEANIRGYSGVKLLVIDEAARVQDSLYTSVRPMLAVSQGSLVCLSSPAGKRGWFYTEYLQPPLA
jgi:phage terminase large subunit-like protein